MGDNLNSEGHADVVGSSNLTLLTSALSQLQVVTSVVSSIPYGNFHIHIFDKANQCSSPNGNQQNHKLYYYSPLSTLDVKSIKAYINPFKPQQQPEVKFNIEMWNEEIKKKVLEHLSKLKIASSLNELTVLVVPYERAFLTSSSPNIDGCRFNTERVLCGQQPKSLTFSLSCPSIEKAEEVAQLMRENPEEFAGIIGLHLHFSSIAVKKRQTRITVDLESNAGIASKLLQKHKASLEAHKAPVVLMSEDATKRLLEELTSISVQTYDEIGEAARKKDIVFNPNDMLREMLITCRETIRRGDVGWDSVFWEDENSRPDFVCRQVNDMEEKFSSEDWNKIASSFQSGKENDFKTNFKTSNKGVTNVKLETESKEDDSGKRVRYKDEAEKKEDKQKSTKDTKTKGEAKANIKAGWLKVGEFSGQFSHDVNQNDESSHLKEEARKHLEDDANQHHKANKFKGAVKVDESDSYQDVNSRSDKEFKSGRVQIDEVLKMLKNNKSHIEWDGKKYVPKSMDLNRINICIIHNRQVFDDLRTNASFVMTSIPLSVNIFRDDQGISKTTEAMEKEIAAKSSEINNAIKEKANLEKKIDALNQKILELSVPMSNLIGINHRGINCRECDGAITGFRYRCAVCEDYNLCGKCETAGRHPQHFLIRVSGALPNCFPALKQLVGSLDEKIAFRPTLEMDEHTTSGTGNVHTDVICNECANRRFDIRGFRYVCLMCDDYNLCHSCETSGKHQNHPMLRLSHISMYGSLTALLRTVLGDMRKKVRRDT